MLRTMTVTLAFMVVGIAGPLAGRSEAQWLPEVRHPIDVAEHGPAPQETLSARASSSRLGATEILLTVVGAGSGLLVSTLVMDDGHRFVRA